MSSSWTERQGQVGDLRQQSPEQLRELLLRQHRILSNQRLLQTLPDKGERIKDFAEKIQLAIEQRSEEGKRQRLISAARAEFEAAFTGSAAAHQSGKEQDKSAEAIRERADAPVSAEVPENRTLSTPQERRTSSYSPDDTTRASSMALSSDETKERELVKALDRVTLSDVNSKDQIKSQAQGNYFLQRQPPKKPPYISVLEKTELSTAPRKQKFKPNQLSSRSDVSPSGSLSPCQSSGSASPLSADARKERDRKHLDDITAAKLPPLHHSPAQLLSLDESAALLKQQIKKQQELQAKQAAHKLSEGLKLSVGIYLPDGGPMAAYRDVYDEGAHLSSDED